MLAIFNANYPAMIVSWFGSAAQLRDCQKYLSIYRYMVEVTLCKDVLVQGSLIIFCCHCSKYCHHISCLWLSLIAKLIPSYYSVIFLLFIKRHL